MQHIREKLEGLYNSFDFEKAVHKDPIRFPKRYTESLDIEISCMIASSFAYGNIKCFCNFLEELFKIIGNNPSDFILNFNCELLLKKLRIKYRFSSVYDIVAFLFILQKMLQNSPSKSLEYYFRIDHDTFQSYSERLQSDFHQKSQLHRSILKISNFVKSALKIDLTPIYNKDIKPRGLLHLLPDPLKGSPCKRINLFLRWMVRNKDVDFGLWSTIRPNELIIPLDVHISRVSKRFGFTKRKTQSIKTALEITEYLKKIDPEDPLKYDFVLCHADINSFLIF